MRYTNNYNWSGLEFPVAINKINEFGKNNNISVNILGVKGQNPYICRKSKYYYRNNIVNLLLIQQDPTFKKVVFNKVKTLLF